MIRERAPGKVILLGEYAVLYGATALVAATDRFARVTLEPQGSFELCALGHELRVEHCDALRAADSRLSLVASVFEQVSGGLPKVRVTINTDEFFQGGTKLGLGSSAAVAVALARALRRLGGESPSAQQLFQDAHAAHQHAQGGVGSGIDIAASAYGGLLAYRAPQPGSQTPS
ncbi:MAG: ATP-binding protein, partial [Myxococcota bacterium]